MSLEGCCGTVPTEDTSIESLVESAMRACGGERLDDEESGSIASPLIEYPC